MHLLTRPQEPECLERLRNANPPLNWSHVTPEQKAQIRGRLVEMQGKFCAYCERHITDEPAHAEKTGHIEHFRKRRDYPELTFAWNNLFYSCCTQDSCGRYGGHRKDSNPTFAPTPMLHHSKLYTTRVATFFPSALFTRSDEIPCGNFMELCRLHIVRCCKTPDMLYNSP